MRGIGIVGLRTEMLFDPDHECAISKFPLQAECGRSNFGGRMSALLETGSVSPSQCDGSHHLENLKFATRRANRGSLPAGMPARRLRSKTV
jgi:hypothetical protein